MTNLFIDVETYSTTSISKSGHYRYTQDPNFRILLFAYKFDDGPARVVDLEGN